MSVVDMNRDSIESVSFLMNQLLYFNLYEWLIDEPIVKKNIFKNAVYEYNKEMHISNHYYYL